MTLVGILFAGVTVLYKQFIVPPEEVEILDENQTELGIDVYSNRERTLLQQEIDVIQNLEKQAQKPVEQQNPELINLLRENKEVLKMEKEQIKKKKRVLRNKYNQNERD